MAEATQAGGFDSCFTETLHDRFLCSICHLGLTDPKLTECGHHFCTGCLNRYCEGRPFSCPVCRTKLDSSKVYPDNALKRQILDLEVFCGRHQRGCEWSGELRNENNHEEECQYVYEACENECGETPMRKDMEDHLDNQCPRRIVDCEHCDMELEFMDLQDHYEICEMYPVECVYSCGEILARYEIQSHVERQGACPNAPVDCDFKNSGCEFQGKRSELSRHIESSVVSHLNLVAMKLATTTEKLESTEDKLAETEGKLEDLELKYYEEVNRRSLSLSPIEPKKFIHKWRIDGWSEKLLAATRENKPVDNIKSDSFYVYPGYHLYLGAYPNGCDPKIGSRLSVFLFVVEGLFDAKVKWPFPYSYVSN
jgi:hypothetical protein